MSAEHARLTDELEALNDRFYQHYAEQFDGTRMSAWAGWAPLIDALPSPPQGLSVLDLGCGNGRLALSLKRAVAQDPRTQPPSRQVRRYVGRDRCEPLLEAARDHALSAALPFSASFERWTWEQSTCDQHHKLKDQAQYDWVTLFGVTHHIYRFERRLQLLVEAASELSPTGVLSVSFWDFGASERWDKRRLPWAPWLQSWGLSEALLEEGDHLLGWGGAEHTPRYCHWVSPQEEEALSEALCERAGLEVVSVTRDPQGHNRYRSWRPQPHLTP